MAPSSPSSVSVNTWLAFRSTAVTWDESGGASRSRSRCEISKRAVWEAYRRVKANKGGAGVDEQSIEEFERNLQGNLFKLWNVCHECKER